MSSKTMKEVLDTAREIYDKTVCGGAGCCGDLDGALEYVDGAVGEMIQGMVNIVVAADIERQTKPSMRKLSDSLYVQDEGVLLLHAHGPEGTPWCLVNTTDIPGKLIAMFAELEEALEFAKIKMTPDTLFPGREWRVSD